MTPSKKTAATKMAPVGWWTTSPTGWTESSDSTSARWRRNHRAKFGLDEAAARGAMAFGYGARTAYGEHRAWKDLEAQLDADWKSAGFELPWLDVQKAVKFGWIAARTEVDSPAAAPADSHQRLTPPHEETASTNVPGGRPDRPAESEVPDKPRTS